MAFRLCDGLSGIRPEETDAVVIAGMGGETIAQILEAAPWVRTRKIPLVLQPMSSIPELRQRLGEDGFHILEERLAREGDTLYVVMRAEAGEEPAMTPAQLWAGRQSGTPCGGTISVDSWRSWTGRWTAFPGRETGGRRTAGGNWRPSGRSCWRCERSGKHGSGDRDL